MPSGDVEMKLYYRDKEKNRKMYDGLKRLIWYTYIYIYIVESEKEGKYTKSMSIGHDDDMISVPIKGQLYWGSRCD